MTGLELRRMLCMSLLAGAVMAGCSRSPTDQATSVARPQPDRQEVAQPQAESQPSQPVAAHAATEMQPSPTVSEKPLVADAGRAGATAVPEVVMAAADRNACKIFVGDRFPAFSLDDVGGMPRTSKELRGAKGTVIVLFQLGEDEIGRLRAENLLSDIQSDVASQFAADEIKVVGIHVGAATDQLAKLLETEAVTFPVLVDKDRKLTDEVTAKKPPCFYVLDADGKVAWLDIEYGPAVRQQLIQAVRALAAR